MLWVEIDEFTPCLKDSFTGDLLDTEVVRIKRKSFLEKYNKKNGWYTSWSSLLATDEIYALVLKGTVDIQGLIAVRNDMEMKAAFVSWMVAAPHNNPLITDQKKYVGVGGHLFAIAGFISEQYGYHGEITGFAANQKLEQHYIKTFNAVPIHMLHPYHIVIEEKSMCEIKEVYTYDWTEDEL